MKTPQKAISQLITQKEILEQLKELGVGAGMILEVHASLSAFGYVCGGAQTVDGRNEKLGYRVREAQTHKIPMQIVVGDGEVENNTATVRRYGKKDSVTISKEELLESILNEIETKARV